jgi:hypothetical protein
LEESRFIQTSQIAESLQYRPKIEE